jgi:dipeptidyl aminopeptidase/acylaminoacyl peptidase
MSKQNFTQYLAIESAGGPTFHPADKNMAVVYNASGVFQVYEVSIEEGITSWPKRLSFSENRCTNPRFLPDGTLIYQTDKGGNENFQIELVDKQKQFTSITSDLSAKYLINMISDQALYFTSNSENKARFDVYQHKFPLENNQAQLVYQPPEGLITLQLTSKDENLLVILRSFSSVHTELHLFNRETGEIKILSNFSDDKTSRWNAVRWIGDNHLLVLTDYQSNYLRLGILDLDGSFIRILKIEDSFPYDVTEAAWSKTDDLTYFIINNDGFSKLYRANFTLFGEMQNLEEFPLPEKAVIGAGDTRTFTKAMSLSNDNKYLALTVSTASQPMNVWILNVENKKLWKATDVSTPRLKPDHFCDLSLQKFNSFDDLEVPYFKYTPKGNKPPAGWPAIFIIHGGPEGQYKPVFDNMVQFYLSANYAVITPNIRGSTGYGRDYMDLDNKEKRLDSILDIKELALHIRQNDLDIDENKLIIYGGSYGGFAVLSAMTEHPELWAAGVDIVGISNFVTFLENTAEWRRKHREGEYGSLEDDYEMLQSISPIHKIDRIQSPLFIIQGDNDERVPLSESIQMYEKLKENGLEVKLLRFADEGHGIVKTKNRILAYSQVVTWLDTVI